MKDHNKHFTVIIAGGGGIGKAVGLLLATYADFDVTLFVGDKHASVANDAARWINEGCEKNKSTGFIFDGTNESVDIAAIFSGADIVLDCLPGSVAPYIGALARKYHLHYINLTEHVKETEQLINIARGADTGFILQTGLAPGFINILACDLYRQFVALYQNKQVEYIGMKVGALTKNAQPPHFYGLTWSPIGVATEYFQNAVVIKNFIKTTVPSLSDNRMNIIDGVVYEEDFTSGGAADLPDAFTGIARVLDYKTLRYPGHYTWVKNIAGHFENNEEGIKTLEKKMLATIPFVQEDMVVLYSTVNGFDKNGNLHSIEKSLTIRPFSVGRQILRAIQATTAAPMAECARMLLLGHHKNGVILQSQIDPQAFLNGPFIKAVYFSEPIYAHIN